MNKNRCEKCGKMVSLKKGCLHCIRPDEAWYKVNEKGCWVWSYYIGKSTYPVFRRKGKMMKAAKYFYERDKGAVPKGLVLDHLCRNRKCVNPKHLEVVTYATNNQRGNQAKLMDKDIKKIRKLYKSKDYKQTTLGKMFDVGQGQISRIVNHQAWTNL